MITVRLILALTLIPFLAFSKKKEIPFIYLNPTQVLQIMVIDNIHDWGDEIDRFHDIEETLEKVLEEIDFPMDYKIVRFGARSPKEQPELQLVIHEWGDTGYGEIEVRLNGWLKETSAGRSKNKLGFFRERGGAAPMFSATQARKQYNEVLGKALVKLMDELNQHFELEIDDPILRGEGLPSSLGTPIPDQ